MTLEGLTPLSSEPYGYNKIAGGFLYIFVTTMRREVRREGSSLRRVGSSAFWQFDAVAAV